MERCYGETYCKQFNERRSNCHQYCIGYVQLNNIYELSNMPKKYRYEADNLLTDVPERDLASFRQLKNWQNNVQENVQQGKGIFLYSEKKGNGKTTWATKMMNEYFKKVALGNNLKCRGLFIEVPKFFKMLRDNMNNPTQEVADFCKNIENADLVIWDDIGAEVPTNWVRENFYIYINHRYSNLKAQIFTSNLPPDVLKDEVYLGERIVSRIHGCCDTFEFYGEDRR